MSVTAPEEARSEPKEMIEVYVVQCEKAIKTGMKTHLPRKLQTKWEEQKRAREKQALAKATNPPTMAGTEPTRSIKISSKIVNNASAQKDKGN